MANHQTSINDTSAKAERLIAAIAVSRGIGIGRAEFLRAEDFHSFHIQIDPTSIEAEVSRFRTAVDSAKLRLNSLSESGIARPGNAVSGIIDVQLLILESSFVDKAETVIREQQVNAEWAIGQVRDTFRERQKNVAESHLREKEMDITDVAERLLHELGNSRAMPTLRSGAVIVARELQPSTMIGLLNFSPAGFVTERGGWTSHTSILAREFAIPMVSGVRLAPSDLDQGSQVIVDGDHGQIILHPSRRTIHDLRTARPAAEPPTNLKSDQPGTTTLDGTDILIRANVELSSTYAIAMDAGAYGIGLYRSESLISESGGFPDEEQQVAAYREIADAAGSFGVNIRTFDIGNDLVNETVPSPAQNPSLGLRSIRLSLSDTGQFRTQIRAILRANAAGNIGILLPMISNLAEIRRSKDIIHEELLALDARGIHATFPRVGAMIEVPSAVLTVRDIARNVDFLCLGTNDLVQYLLAVDRDNDLVAEWYQTLHPAVLRAIREVSAAGVAAGIPVVACGEMAGSAFYVPLLLGLGIREMSITVAAMPPLRKLIAGISIEATTSLAHKAESCETSADVESLLRNYYLQNWNDLFPPGLLNATHR